MKKSPFAGLIAVLLLGSLLSAWGCGGGGPAGATITNEPEGEVYKEKPIDPIRIVDTNESWRKFVAEAKQPERFKAAQELFEAPNATYKLQVVFMGKPDEIEWVQFGSFKLKDVDPERLYEVGIVRLATKETYGADGFQIREYVLQFITPRRDGEWRYVTGTYKVPKSQGVWAVDASQTFSLPEGMFDQSYLRHLFVKPLPTAKPVATNAGQAGLEAPVDTRAPR